MNLNSFLHHHRHTHTSSRDHQDPFFKRLTNDPYLDWLIMMIISFIVSVIFIASGYFIYGDVQTRLQVGSNKVLNPNLIFNSDSFEKTLKKLNERALEQVSVIQENISIPDPSL